MRILHEPQTQHLRQQSMRMRKLEMILLHEPQNQHRHPLYYSAKYADLKIRAIICHYHRQAHKRAAHDLTDYLANLAMDNKQSIQTAHPTNWAFHDKVFKLLQDDVRHMYIIQKLNTDKTRPLTASITSELHTEGPDLQFMSGQDNIVI